MWDLIPKREKRRGARKEKKGTETGKTMRGKDCPIWGEA